MGFGVGNSQEKPSGKFSQWRFGFEVRHGIDPLIGIPAMIAVGSILFLPIELFACAVIISLLGHQVVGQKIFDWAIFIWATWMTVWAFSMVCDSISKHGL